MNPNHLTDEQLLALAKTASPIPYGATHVVLRKDGSKVEFGWEHKGDIFDEPPAPNEGWNSAYKWAYWKAFALEDVYPDGLLVIPDGDLFGMAEHLPWLKPLEGAPPEGWTEQAYYRVVVELFNGNVAHDAILFTGFLNKGLPRSYSCILCPTYDSGHARLLDYPDMRVKVLSKLFQDKGMYLPTTSKTAP